jgi:hypothetical protein
LKSNMEMAVAGMGLARPEEAHFRKQGSDEEK